MRSWLWKRWSITLLAVFPPRDATLKAMEEVFGPVVAIALILSAVFVPVAFLGGIAGGHVQAVCHYRGGVNHYLSAFVALSLTPALCTLLLRPKRQGHDQTGFGRFFGAFNHADLNV